jgi:hypothetical protein
VNDPRQNRDLRELFQGLRAEDRERAPDFVRLMGRLRQDASTLDEEGSTQIPAPAIRGRRRWSTGRRGVAGHWVRSHQRWTWAGSLLAAAAVAGLLLLGPGRSADTRFEHAVRSFVVDPAAGSWRSPTDRLLQVPGQELLTTIPTIGRPSWPGRAGVVPPRNQL